MMDLHGLCINGGSIIWCIGNCGKVNAITFKFSLTIIFSVVSSSPIGGCGVSRHLMKSSIFITVQLMAVFHRFYRFSFEKSFQ